MLPFFVRHREVFVPKTCALEPLEGRLLFSTPASPSGNNLLIHSTASLPSLGDVTAITVGNVALFASNSSQSLPASSKVVDIYDGSTHRWSKSHLSQARGGMATATLGKWAIFAGGEVNSPEYSTAIDLYDSSTYKWSKAKLSVARSGIASASMDNEAVFAGGITATGFSDAVDIFHAQTGKWAKSKLSEARADMSAVAAGHFAFIAGGMLDSASAISYSDRVDIYDSRRNRWTTARLSQARSNISAVAVGSKVIFAGGKSGNSESSNVVDIYDLATGGWSTSILPQARTDLSAAVVGHAVIFAGGSVEMTSGSSAASDLAEIYDVNTAGWSAVRLAESRSRETVVRLGTNVLIAGGTNDFGNPSNDVDIFNTRTGSMTTRMLTTVSSFRSMGGTTLNNAAIFVSDSPFSAGGQTIADIFSEPRGT